jgi:superfamily II DNA or RNA helicase
MYSDFKNDYGWTEIEKHVSPVHSQIKEGKLTASEKEELIRLGISEDIRLKRVVLITWQSLQYKSPEFFKRFGAVLVDEAHSSKADVLQEILYNCKNAHVKVGVSGTLTDDGIASALVESALGQKKVIVRSKELIDRGLLTKTDIYTIFIPYDEESKKLVHRQDFDGEVALLSYNGSKLAALKSLIDANQIKPTENTVILFKLTDTLFSMHEYFQKNYPQFKSILYYGNIKAGEREKIRGEIEKEGGYLIFATYGTMKQGINIKRLHNVVFAECSKSLTMVIQSIGRILRVHWDKTVARVFDIVDDCSYMTRPRKGGYPKRKLNYAMQHYETRKKFYAAEEFPITEITAPFVAKADISDAERERQKSKDSAAEKKPKKKTSQRREVGDVSKFFD